MSERQYQRLMNRRMRRLLAWLARQFVADMRALLRDLPKAGNTAITK